MSGWLSGDHLLEVVKLLLQDLDLLQVWAHLLIGKGALLLIDPLLELISFTEQHEFLAALFQHVLTFLSQFQQSTIPRKQTTEGKALENQSVGRTIVIWSELIWVCAGFKNTKEKKSSLTQSKHVLTFNSAPTTSNCVQRFSFKCFKYSVYGSDVIKRTLTY